MQKNLIAILVMLWSCLKTGRFLCPGVVQSNLHSRNLHVLHCVVILNVRDSTVMKDSQMSRAILIEVLRLRLFLLFSSVSFLCCKLNFISNFKSVTMVVCGSVSVLI